MHAPNSKPLLLLATYWPSGDATEALDERMAMEGFVSDQLQAAKDHCVLMIGDMNATYRDADRA
jgi:hypothetical protein